jgi:hypothetical protein
MAMKTLIYAVCLCIGQAALAAEPSFKFTVGSYNATGGDIPDARGTDINLRNASNYGNTWVGFYKQGDVKQWRAGWDNSFNVGSIKLQPSLQAASGGFVGGSFGIETGESIHKNWYAGVGIGRTNLKPYVNLNFDPNDALMASAGYRFSKQESLGLQWVRDNRLNVDQQNVHLLYRKVLNPQERITLDLFSKTGSVGLITGNTEKINKFGLALGYDWNEYFIKAAYDPRVNFTTQNMLRLSGGIRF